MYTEGLQESSNFPCSSPSFLLSFKRLGTCCISKHQVLVFPQLAAGKCTEVSKKIHTAIFFQGPLRLYARSLLIIFNKLSECLRKNSEVYTHYMRFSGLEMQVSVLMTSLFNVSKVQNLSIKVSSKVAVLILSALRFLNCKNQGK